MGIVLGILVYAATAVTAFVVLMFGPGADPGTAKSAGRPALAVLVVGGIVGTLLVVSHFHPLRW